jgi:hypothetical protein
MASTVSKLKNMAKIRCLRDRINRLPAAKKGGPRGAV